MDDKDPEIQLDSLHSLVTEVLLTRLKSGECTAAEISAAIKHLADNGINCDGKKNKSLRLLKKVVASDIPIGDDEDERKPIKLKIV